MKLKFGSLWEKARSIDYIATGHYAIIDHPPMRCQPGSLVGGPAASRRPDHRSG
jgi:hypothetical protein